MLYSVPVTSFPAGYSRRGGQCSLFGPPDCLGRYTETPHYLFRRNLRHKEPNLQDFAEFWKALVKVSSNGEEKPQLSKWTKQVRCEEFTSEDITASISDQKVILRGLRESSDGDGESEVHQMKRTIVIPADVNSDSIKAFFNQDGTLVLEGERKCIERNVSVNEGQHNTSNQGETTESILSQTVHTESEARKSNESANCEGSSTDKTETCVMQYVDGAPGGGRIEVKPHEEKNKTTEKDSKNGNSHEVQNETDTYQTTTANAETLDTGTAEKSISSEREESKVISNSKTPEQEFKLEVDMSSFNPESVVVKSTPDSVTIVGKQDEVDQKTGKITSTKTLLRKFFLPVSVNSDLLKSELSNGKLNISGPYRK